MSKLSVSLTSHLSDKSGFKSWFYIYYTTIRPLSESIGENGKYNEFHTSSLFSQSKCKITHFLPTKKLNFFNKIIWDPNEQLCKYFTVSASYIFHFDNESGSKTDLEYTSRSLKIIRIRRVQIHISDRTVSTLYNTEIFIFRPFQLCTTGIFIFRLLSTLYYTEIFIFRVLSTLYYGNFHFSSLVNSVLQYMEIFILLT